LVLFALTKNNNKSLMRFVSQKLKSSKEFILNLAKSDLLFFKYCTQNLKDDKEFVMKIIKFGKKPKTTSFDIYESLSKRLKEDKEIIWEALKKDIYSSYHIYYDFLEDKEFILSVIKNFGPSTTIFTCGLNDDDDVIMEAIKKDGIFLEIASDRLKNDKNIIMTALNNNPWALQFIPEKFMKDKKLLKSLVKRDGEVLRALPNNILYNSKFVDKEILEIAIKDFPECKILLEKIKKEEDTFYNLKDRGTGVIGVLELVFQKIENLGEEFQNKCSYTNLSWHETKKMIVRSYLAKDLPEEKLWKIISDFSHQISKKISNL
jgi:hypothetical protein